MNTAARPVRFAGAIVAVGVIIAGCSPSGGPAASSSLQPTEAATSAAIPPGSFPTPPAAPVPSGSPVPQRETPLTQVTQDEWVTSLDAKVAEFFTGAAGKQVTITRVSTADGTSQAPQTMPAETVTDKPSGAAIVAAMGVNDPSQLAFDMDASTFLISLPVDKSIVAQSIAFEGNELAYMDADGNLIVFTIAP